MYILLMIYKSFEGDFYVKIKNESFEAGGRGFRKN